MQREKEWKSGSQKIDCLPASTYPSQRDIVTSTTTELLDSEPTYTIDMTYCHYICILMTYHRTVYWCNGAKCERQNVINFMYQPLIFQNRRIVWKRIKRVQRWWRDAFIHIHWKHWWRAAHQLFVNLCDTICTSSRLFCWNQFLLLTYKTRALEDGEIYERKARMADKSCQNEYFLLLQQFQGHFAFTI